MMGDRSISRMWRIFSVSSQTFGPGNLWFSFEASILHLDTSKLRFFSSPANCFGSPLKFDHPTPMNTRIRFLLVVFGTGLALLGLPDAAYAYGGPGSVISGIGTLLAALAAIVASLFGFLWFPLKRLYRKMQGEQESAAVEADASGE